MRWRTDRTPSRPRVSPSASSGERVTVVPASLLDALGALVGSAHVVTGVELSPYVVDGRTPHSVIAELFTDRGVGTLVTRGSPA